MSELKDRRGEHRDVPQADKQGFIESIKTERKQSFLLSATFWGVVLTAALTAGGYFFSIGRTDHDTLLQVVEKQKAIENKVDIISKKGTVDTSILLEHIRLLQKELDILERKIDMRDNKQIED